MYIVKERQLHIICSDSDPTVAPVMITPTTKSWSEGNDWRWRSVRIKIRIRVGVRFNVYSIYHWCNCRRSKCYTFVWTNIRLRALLAKQGGMLHPQMLQNILEYSGIYWNIPVREKKTLQ